MVSIGESMSTFDKLIDEYAGKVACDVYFDGNFTVAIISEKGHHAIGVAKCNPSCDEYNRDRGGKIAVARALVNLDKQLQPWRYSKDKTK
jgi:hypothetical protein